MTSSSKTRWTNVGKIVIYAWFGGPWVGVADHHSVGTPTHPNEWQIYPSGRFQEGGKSICFQMENPGMSASFGKLGTTPTAPRAFVGRVKDAVTL
jgi:hypothetical protein